MTKNRECSYEEMSGEGKEGGQSITRIDNSIHSEIWDEVPINSYENSRKSFMGERGFDWSGMKGAK
jgi:hypothetical protein